MDASPTTEVVPPPEPGAAAPPSPVRLRLHAPSWGSLSLIGVWILTILLFGIIEPSKFLSLQTVQSVASAQAITAIMAISLVAPIAAGVFDLSIGNNMGLAVILVAVFQAKFGIPWVPAVLLTLLAGLLVGAVNAFIVVRLRVNSFIATLGTMSILEAILQGVSGGNQIVSGISTTFSNLGADQVLGITTPFYFMLVIAAVLWYVMEYRQLGRYLYATGSNSDAARLAGVRTDRITTIALLMSGFIAALAGVILTMEIGAAAVDAGSPYLLPAFAAVFLGATQFRARRVNVLGTILAVYVLATGVQGIDLAGAPFWVQDIFDGVALIIAVALAVRAARKSRVIKV